MKIEKLFIIILLNLFILMGCNTTNKSVIKTTGHSLYDSSSVKIGVQLWSVKKDIRIDFEGTLKRLAKMNFDGVELGGYLGPYQNDPAGLKLFLDNIGLQISSAHVNIKKFSDSEFNKTVNFYKALGVNTLIIPWSKRSFDATKVDEFIAELNKISSQLSAHGMQLGFHNHAGEFNDYKEATFWDHIAQSTTRNISLQLDVGWVTYAKKDPVSYVNRYPGRTLTSHIKAKIPKSVIGKRPIIGEDITDWPAIIKAELKTGGTQWFIIEQEDYPDGLTPFEALKLSKQGFDKVFATIK